MCCIWIYTLFYKYFQADEIMVQSRSSNVGNTHIFVRGLLPESSSSGHSMGAFSFWFYIDFTEDTETYVQRRFHCFLNRSKTRDLSQKKILTMFRELIIYRFTTEGKRWILQFQILLLNVLFCYTFFISPIWMRSVTRLCVQALYLIKEIVTRFCVW